MFIWMAKFRCRLWRAHRHPCRVDVLINQLNAAWRKRVILFGLFGGALFTFYRRHHGRKFVIELMSTDQVLARLELPSWIRLRLHSARLLSDVLPVSCRSHGPISGPANCRIMMRPMSRGSSLGHRAGRARRSVMSAA